MTRSSARRRLAVRMSFTSFAVAHTLFTCKMGAVGAAQAPEQLRTFPPPMPSVSRVGFALARTSFRTSCVTADARKRPQGPGTTERKPRREWRPLKTQMPFSVSVPCEKEQQQQWQQQRQQRREERKWRAGTHTTAQPPRAPVLLPSPRQTRLTWMERSHHVRQSSRPPSTACSGSIWSL